MAQSVKDWMSKPVVVVDPDSCVSYALTVMRRRNIHSVVIALEDRMPKYGILTTTDIRDKVIAADRNPAEIHVREIMTAPVETARLDWTLKDCGVAMQKLNIHHMPVVDEDGELVGMISATDLFIAAEETGWETSG